MTTNSKIERVVLDLHRELWRRAKRLGGTNIDPIALLDPANVAEVLGVQLEMVAGFSAPRDRHITGMLDRDQNKIFISNNQSLEEMRFTAAHEFGHFELHEDQRLFRDRAIQYDERSLASPNMESEANQFGGSLLIPENLLHTQLKETFNTRFPLIFSDTLAYHLCPEDRESLLEGDDVEIHRAFALARATSFNGRQFHPLYKQFKVSKSAMAVRILRLGIVGDRLPAEFDEPKSRSKTKLARPLFSPGLHEIPERDLEEVFVYGFAEQKRRRELIGSFRALIAYIRQVGINCEIWIDGSMSTDKTQPNDVDVAVFIAPGQIADLTVEQRAELELLKNRELMLDRYSCDVYVGNANNEEEKDYFRRTFGDHYGVAKGIPFVRILD